MPNQGLDAKLKVVLCYGKMLSEEVLLLKLAFGVRGNHYKMSFGGSTMSKHVDLLPWEFRTFAS